MIDDIVCEFLLIQLLLIAASVAKIIIFSSFASGR